MMLDIPSLDSAVRRLREGLARHRCDALDEQIRDGLPPNSAVGVFGSRATAGRARCCSDLDPAIDAERRLTLDDFARLNEAFDDSDLPCTVDVVDWLAIDDRFRRLIAQQRVALAAGSSAPAHDPSGGAGTPA